MCVCGGVGQIESDREREIDREREREIFLLAMLLSGGKCTLCVHDLAGPDFAPLLGKKVATQKLYVSSGVLSARH